MRKDRNTAKKERERYLDEERNHPTGVHAEKQGMGHLSWQKAGIFQAFLSSVLDENLLLRCPNKKAKEEDARIEAEKEREERSLKKKETRASSAFRDSPCVI